MIKLLIADDEEIIRNGLAHSVDWETMGVECVGSASTGEEAYKLILEKQPEVVITDIKMPIMTGLELIEKVKKENINVCFVIISGYADFEYARQAMRYGVMYYLLKPVGFAELEEVIRDISANLNCDSFEKIVSKNEKKAIEEKYGDVLKKVFEYSMEHISDSTLNLGFIAKDIVYMNSDYFGRVFRIATGKYYTQYVMELRIQKAKELLKDKDMMIYEVAFMVGFANNSTYFGQVFKRYTGETPKEYRSRYVD